MKQRIALLGSTGSIGTQTLDVVRQYGELFEITTLTAGNNWQLLVRQAEEFSPDSVVIANKAYYGQVRDALASLLIKVYAGSDAIAQVVRGDGVDVVVNALVGYAGLMPTVSAVQAGKKVALANKESLVVAGDLVMRLAAEHRAPILPIDSEHSAIFQSLVGETSPIEKILLTSSGGPFLHTSAADLATVTVEDALRHPNWSMGAKITIDSATMMNKGFEVIEARWLFGVPAERIEVVVHPQSVIHSMVQFSDGAVKAQLGTPDMHLPIQYALTYPQRLPLDGRRFDFAACGQFTFFAPDTDRFPTLRFAYEALERGGTSGCTLNGANEVAVRAFLERRIGFTEITRVISRTIERATFVARPTLDDYRASDTESRALAEEEVLRSACRRD